MDKFKIHQIINIDDPYFDEFWRISTISFPIIERRTIEQQTDVMNTSGYSIFVFTDNNLFCNGLISFWKTTEFIFIEHFAIAPEFRNQGIGKAILTHFLENCIEPIILEIELPVDLTARRRLQFYESLRFKLNDHLHYQPPYHQFDDPVPMKILSFPDRITKRNYLKFARFQKEIILGKVR